jgi:hypothetical protein
MLSPPQSSSEIEQASLSPRLILGPRPAQPCDSLTCPEALDARVGCRPISLAQLAVLITQSFTCRKSQGSSAPCIWLLDGHHCGYDHPENDHGRRACGVSLVAEDLGLGRRSFPPTFPCTYSYPVFRVLPWFHWRGKTKTKRVFAFNATWPGPTTVPWSADRQKGPFDASMVRKRHTQLISQTHVIRERAAKLREESRTATCFQKQPIDLKCVGFARR